MLKFSEKERILLMHKLYYENSYINQCNSNIIDMIEKDGRILVVLDITPFYPEGGGQPSDRGKIDEANVIEVFEKNDIVYHVVDRKLETRSVSCSVDFQRRFDHMQQHSGEHLLSAAFYKLFGGVNCGFHMGEDYVTIDINLNDISEEMIRKVESETNEYVYRNLEVYTYVVSKAECDGLPFRKEIKVDGAIRIVQMGDIDYSACCGTHVVRTGEVGVVKITRAEKYKGMTRVYFKCGRRALKDYINKQDIVSVLTRQLSADEGSIIGKVEAQSAVLKELGRQLSDAKMALAQYDANALIKTAASKTIVKNYDDRSFEEVQLISSVLENEPYVTVLSSSQDKRVIMTQTNTPHISCGKIFKEHLGTFKGKGGGSDKKAQAAFTTLKDLEEFVRKVSEEVIVE
jgi:alanyl-tRNA synthetase